MVDLNAPYPSTAYLTGYLASKHIETQQWDASLDLFLCLHSRRGIEQIRQALARPQPDTSARTAQRVEWFMRHADQHEVLIEPVIRFLQGSDSTLAHRLAAGLLPPGPARGVFSDADLDAAFGSLGIVDRAKYLATRYLRNLAEVIASAIDRHWSDGTGYGIPGDPCAFDPYEEALARPRTLVVDLMLELLAGRLAACTPQVVGMTLPFYGNLLAALHFAKYIRETAPGCRIVWGGGVVNTSMRSLSDPRLFKYVDFVTVDDGERPLECIVEALDGRRDPEQLLRTFVCTGGAVHLVSSAAECDVPHRETPTPSYEGLPLRQYVSLLKVPNPVQRLWSEGRWNKLTLAHGCYWGKCTFCDIALDYVARYEPAHPDAIVDRMIDLMRDTGESGFHFVDEAAPPALLRGVSRRLLERGVTATWWTNIRFEKSFDAELVRLMARSGCIAVTGGLEIASDRLLKLINKGVTVAQVARVTKAFTDAGIGVHAYLMYGFPTQTDQEVIDSLEVVRQLFAAGCLHSGFWHEFNATVHSPVGMRPDLFGARVTTPIALQWDALRRHTKSLKLPQGAAGPAHLSVGPGAHDLAPPTFMQYNVGFDAATRVSVERFRRGLRRAQFYYMHGLKVDRPVRHWFEHDVPEPTVNPTLVADFLAAAREGGDEAKRAAEAVEAYQ
jgi:hypothetical protein